MQTVTFLRDDGTTVDISMPPNETKFSAKKERIVELPTALFGVRNVKTLWVRATELPMFGLLMGFRIAVASQFVDQFATGDWPNALAHNALGARFSNLELNFDSFCCRNPLIVPSVGR